MDYYLAIDMGASGGRCILGSLQSDKILTEEVYRFENGIIDKGGKLCWDLDALWDNILKGMRRCKEIGKIPTSVSVNTWGVDYVLLYGDNNIIGDAVAYRDSRTQGKPEEVYKIMPEVELYKRTGVAGYIYNTIFQLKSESADRLKTAETLLFIPDYFHFLLSGVKKTEVTIASTSGLINLQSRTWDTEILSALDFPHKLFQEIVPPGTKLGSFTPELQEAVGYNADVVVSCTHDTASAAMAIPSTEKDIMFISSGTWSLMGTVNDTPVTTPESMSKSFTNEVGFGNSNLFIKNIPGLWMLQEVRREFDDLSYEEMMKNAELSTLKSYIDPSDSRFFAPKSMTMEIKAACHENRMISPVTPGEFAVVIYNSLAKCYAETAKELENLCGKEFSAIHIIGGGSNATLLNRLTANYTGKKVFVGHSEATVIGNIAAQMTTDSVFCDISHVL